VAICLQRIELLKHVNNILDENMKNWFSRRPAPESYVQGEMVIHSHLVMYLKSVCCLVRGANSRMVRRNPEYGGAPMIVWVKPDQDSLQGVVSRVKAQPLSQCDMREVESVKKIQGNPIETLWEIHDRALRRSLLEKNDKSTEQKDEVWNWFLDRISTEYARFALLQIDCDRISLQFHDGIEGNPRVSNVFACPEIPATYQVLVVNSFESSGSE